MAFPPSFVPPVGTPVCDGFETMDEFLAWNPGSRTIDAYNVACVDLVQPAQSLLPSRPMILDCHDMDGGYVPNGDAWPQGVPSFNIYTHTFWSSIDLFVYFGHKREIIIPPPWWTNAAHRNNVPVLGTLQYEGEGKFNDLVQVFASRQTDKFVAQLVTAMNFFKFDGWYFNVEQPHWNPPPGYRANLLALVQALDEALLPSGGITAWYDSIGPDGTVKYSGEVSQQAGNLDFFHSVNSMFIDYVWSAPASLDHTLKSVGPEERRKVMFGVRGFMDASGVNGRHGQFGSSDTARVVTGRGLSHGQFAGSWTYQKSDGDPDDYEARDLCFWAGDGTRNTTTGFASIVPPRLLAVTPFVTAFSTGKGHQFSVRGVPTTGDWGNLSVQDLLPPWRFQVTPNGLGVAFDYSKSFHAGNSISFTPAGGTGPWEVDLFSTKIPLSEVLFVRCIFQGDPHFSLRFSLQDGTFIDLTGDDPQQPGTGVIISPKHVVDVNGWTERQYIINHLPENVITCISVEIGAIKGPLNLGYLALIANMPFDDAFPNINNLKASGVNVTKQSDGSMLVTATVSWQPDDKSVPVACVDIFRDAAAGPGTWVGRAYVNQYFVAVTVSAGTNLLLLLAMPTGVDSLTLDATQCPTVQIPLT